jgi:hypothetical protein
MPKKLREDERLTAVITTRLTAAEYRRLAALRALLGVRSDSAALRAAVLGITLPAARSGLARADGGPANGSGGD